MISSGPLEPSSYGVIPRDKGGATLHVDINLEANQRRTDISTTTKYQQPPVCGNQLVHIDQWRFSEENGRL